LVARLIDENLQTSLDTLQHVSFHDLPMDLGCISAPALVVAGEHDVAAPPIVIKQFAENCRTRRIWSYPARVMS
jgi:hypothetical protein